MPKGDKGEPKQQHAIDTGRVAGILQKVGEYGPQVLDLVGRLAEILQRRQSGGGTWEPGAQGAPGDTVQHHLEALADSIEGRGPPPH